MAEGEEVKFDRIGDWSAKKLEIVGKYAVAYSRLLSAKRQSWAYPIYIDAFAGYGVNISKTTGELIDGSALKVLRIEPAFKEYHFIELDTGRLEALTSIVTEYVEGSARKVYLYEGDCNKVLQSTIFPKIKTGSKIRALCFLDPKGLHFNWDTVCAAADTRRVDLLLNLSIYDANRNIFIQDLGKLQAPQISRADAVWGDKSWLDIATSGTLFKDIGIKTATNDDIATAYRRRLRDAAGFAYVSEYLPMRNQKGAVVYYLFFASHNKVAASIVTDIFRKFRSEKD